MTSGVFGLPARPSGDSMPSWIPGPAHILLWGGRSLRDSLPLALAQPALEQALCTEHPSGKASGRRQRSCGVTRPWVRILNYKLGDTWQVTHLWLSDLFSQL